MKKVCALLLALILVLSLVACGGSGEKKEDTSADGGTTEAEVTEAVETKDDLLAVADTKMWTTDDIDKMGDNAAYAKSLIGNVYKFQAKVDVIEENYVRVAEFYVENNYNSKQYYGSITQLVADIYLPTEELAGLERNKPITVVGKLTDVTSHDETLDITYHVTDLVFGNAYIVAE